MHMSSHLAIPVPLISRCLHLRLFNHDNSLSLYYVWSPHMNCVISALIFPVLQVLQQSIVAICDGKLYCVDSLDHVQIGAPP